MKSGELAQDLGQIGGEIVGVNLPRRGVLGNHYDVPACWYPSVDPQPLAHEAPDSIPNDRVPYFLGDRDPESSDEPGIITFSRKRQDMTSVELLSFLLDLHELGTTADPHLLRDAARHAYFLAIVTEMRLRPFERRRRRTSRPPRVFLRARKPCVRLRLLLWGWYVHFTAYLLASASRTRQRSGIDTQPSGGCQGADREDREGSR